MVVEGSVSRLVSLFIFMTITGLFLYFLGSKFRFRVQRMVSSQRVFFEVPKDNVRTVKLKNGMKIVVFKNQLKPKVLMRVCYNVGSANESSSERGLAHLLEHMIFKGTEKLSETDINAIVRKYGATANASTSFDYTNYFFEIDKNNWEPFLDILSDCMKNAKFDQQALASELKAVVAELNLNRDNHVRSMLFKALELLFPANHPYHFPVIGFKEELANISAQDLFDFYKRYYHPSNAVLFIVGDIDLDHALTLAKESFEEIPSSGVEVEDPSFPIVTNHLEEMSHKIYEDVLTESLCYFWLLPGSKDRNDVAFDIANKMLAEDRNSFLYRRLVDKEGVALCVSSYIFALKEAGIAFIVIKPKLGAAGRCEEFLKEELTRLAEKGVTQEDVAKYVPTQAKDFIEGLLDFQKLSYEWMKFYFEKGKIIEYFNNIDELYNLKAEEVTKIYRENFFPDGLKKIHLLPIAAERKNLWSKNNQLILQQEQKILLNHARTTKIEAPKHLERMPEVRIMDFQVPNPTSEIEINKIPVLFYQDDRLPVTNFLLRFKDGEFLEHALPVDFSMMMSLLLEGSVGLSKKNHLDFFDEMGADCSFSSSGVGCRVLEANFLPVLERIFYIIKKPTFRRDAFEKTKEILLNQLLLAQGDASKIASRYFFKNVFKNTAFDYSFEDKISEIKNLALRDIVFAHKELNPSAVVLGVSGAFNKEKVVATITKCTKNWNDLGVSKARDLPSPSSNSCEAKDLELLRDQTLFYLGYLSDVTLTHSDYPYLLLASYIAFVGFDSRMYKIREQTGLFYGSSGGFSAMCGTSFSHNFIKTLLSPSNLVEGETVIRQMLDELLDGGVTEDEVAGAKRSFLSGMLDRYSCSGSVINSFLYYVTRGLSPSLPQEIWEKIRNAAVEDVNGALRRNFNPSNLTRIRVGRII